MKSPIGGSVAALLLLTGTMVPTIAQGANEGSRAVLHWKSLMLDSVASGLAAGDTIAAELRAKRPFTHLLLRRTIVGDAELHEHDVDLVQVRSGRARLTTGGVLDGHRRKVSTGEWRASSIRGGASREVGPGDMLFIPARVPHLWEPVGSEPFVYVIVKVSGGK